MATISYSFEVFFNDILVLFSCIQFTCNACNILDSQWTDSGQSVALPPEVETSHILCFFLAVCSTFNSANPSEHMRNEWRFICSKIFLILTIWTAFEQICEFVILWKDGIIAQEGKTQKAYLMNTRGTSNERHSFSHSSLQNTMLWPQNNCNILRDVKTDTSEHQCHIKITPSGMFRVGFGVGGIYNMIMH